MLYLKRTNKPYTRHKQTSSDDVVILNVPESTKPVADDRHQDDIASVTALIPQELSDIISNIKLRPLGKPAQGRTCPVLLYTPSATAARTILKCRPTHNPDIRFKPSLTKAQQLHLSTLRSGLDDLTKIGDTNCNVTFHVALQ
ncbi:hypothetical protein KQX54_011906 [Cotesia glomerata]|uniref:Uncharacterized protein n=1 Tax=Cotesia glomerata TaxID=32391 RepID=A0AAV7IZ15_COTGL|nr:hypothetical protein KQX54_011906 [Cotesia glomerata]